MHRVWALVERELRRFRRSPTLMVISILFPVVQLIVLGYAFGGNVKHLRVGVVDQDHGLSAVKVRELTRAVAAGARTFDVIEYADSGRALQDLRDGRLNGVLLIPPEFSRKTLGNTDPRLALIEDNTDNVVASTLAAAAGGLVQAFNEPVVDARRLPRQVSLDVIEVYPYVPYIQYLLPGSIVMAMIGGGIIFIDDKARGLHEGYLVTPVTKFELIAGFNLSGAIKAVAAGVVLMIVGSLVAGIPNPFAPLRLFKLFLVITVTALALVCMMFLLMVRVTDPLVPRAIFGVLNTVLYFPSGAVYPQEGLPTWLRAIAAVDPFTYAVHALKSLLLKNTGIAAVSLDLAYLVVFAVLAMAAATVLFRRTL